MMNKDGFEICDFKSQIRHSRWQPLHHPSSRLTFITHHSAFIIFLLELAHPNSRKESEREMHEELVSLMPDPEVTRRRFIVTSLAAGFALAVRPAVGQTVITTDTQGLVAGEVKIPVADGE